MSRKLQTIYEYLHEYSEEEINQVIASLSAEEQALMRSRYGSDLHNPTPSEDWDRKKATVFYNKLIPKIKRLLREQSQTKEEESDTVSLSSPSIQITKDSPALLQLLRSGKNNKEICTELNITPEKLYEELLKLKNKGMRLSRRYYSDGTIKYRIDSTALELNTYKTANSNKTIITNTSVNSMKLLLISDLHLGNEEERLDLINRAFNYAVKRGIHIILCGGDFIDGAFTKGNQKISDLYKQVEYFIENYPHDNSILTFGVGGDHDLSVLAHASIDLIEALNNYRHDIIIGDYNNTQINLRNDKIHLYHHTDNGLMQTTDAPIILHGHSHKYKTEMKNNALNITLPSLSNINEPLPSALELELHFNKGYIESATIKQIHFGEADILLSESEFDTLGGRRTNYASSGNAEILREKGDTTMTLKRTNTSISQVDRFNKRYGLQK